MVVAKSKGANTPAALRAFELELVCEDRLGVVSNLMKMLTERGVSIESIHTDIVRGGSQASRPQGRAAFADAYNFFLWTRCRKSLIPWPAR
jgi:glycine cleavage system regulatory protein